MPPRPLAALACLLSLWACAPGADLPPLPEYGAPNYRLGAGDKIRVITFGEDQLTGEFRVDDRGNIALPLVGSVRASGRTPEELDSLIQTELQDKNLLRNPSVSVEVVAYRPIFVLGEVARPGQYPYQPGMTMLTAVAVAGGFTYRGVQDYAEVIRTVGGKAIDGRVAPSSFIAPGDVVKIYERRF